MNRSQHYSMEKIFKAVANHRRIQIIDLLRNKPDLSVVEISEVLKVDYRTISDHIRKLSNAGIIFKTHDGNFIRHKLSPKGESILEFCKILQ